MRTAELGQVSLSQHRHSSSLAPRKLPFKATFDDPASSTLIVLLLLAFRFDENCLQVEQVGLREIYRLICLCENDIEVPVIAIGHEVEDQVGRAMRMLVHGGVIGA